MGKFQRWSDCDDYCLRHLFEHLLRAERWDEIVRVMTDSEFLEAKTTRLDIGLLLADLQSTVSMRQIADESRRFLQGLLLVTAREAHNLSRWDQKLYPALFAQQLYYRAAVLGLQEVKRLAHQRLRQLEGPFLECVWCALRTSSAMELTIKSEGSGLSTVAFFPDGRRVISGAENGDLLVWDIETGQKQSTLGAHLGKILAVEVSADGQRCISNSEDGVIKAWDIASKKVVWSKEYGGPTSSLALFSDGKRVAVASAGVILRVLDLATGRVLREQGRYGPPYTAVTVVPGGETVIAAVAGSRLRAWNLTNGQALDSGVTDKEWKIVALCAIANCSKVAALDAGGQVWLWDMRKNSILRLGSHRGAGADIRAIPGKERVISASWDGTLAVWDLRTRELVHTLVGHESQVRAVAVSPNGSLVVSASSDSTIRVWNLHGEPAAPNGHEASVYAVAVEPDGGVVCSLSEDCSLKTWDLRSGTLLADSVCTIFEPNRIVRRRGGVKEYQIKKPLSGAEVSIALAPPEPKIAYVSTWTILKTDGGGIEVWGLETGEHLYDLGGAGTLVALSQDGRQIMSSLESSFWVWNLDDEQKLKIATNVDRITAIGLAPDGLYAVIGSETGMVQIWDLCSRVLDTTLALPGKVGTVGMVAGKSKRVFASVGRSLQVWDGTLRQNLAPLFLDGTIQCLATTQDGSTVLVGDALGSTYCLHYHRGFAVSDRVRRIDLVTPL